MSSIADMAYIFWFLVLLSGVVYCIDPEVTINLGTVRGKTVTVWGQKVDQFLSIPYAKPPIGDLRFRKPDELTEKWSETLIAQSMPNSCFQSPDILASLSGSQIKVGPDELESEDCLYLNIWTPSNRSESKQFPVMFWIHGGGFIFGASRNIDGAKLSTTTNTVVVIINYRLTLFGFIYGNSNEMPGNMGLYDQRLAMKWTKENIRQFGGDPNQITIFGESAGGMSVSDHLMSPISWPYFKRAIIMSGVGIDYILFDEKYWALKKSKAVANSVGCKVDAEANELPMSTISCLRQKNPLQLLVASLNDTVPILGFMFPINIFYPIFGDEFIEKPPREIWKQNQLKPDTDLLIGTVFNEINARKLIRPEDNPSDAMRRLYTVIPKAYLTQEQIEQLIKIQFMGMNEVENREAAIQAANQLQANIMFQCPTNEFADRFSRIESNTVHQYVFNYKGSNDSEPGCEEKYPCHASDVKYTFGKVTHPMDIAASKTLMEIFGHFAYTGKTFWPKYYRTNEGELIPVYNEFKGNKQLNYTQIGFQYFQCKIWSSMAMK